MKKTSLLILFIAVIFAVGCGSSKKTVKADVQKSEQVKTEVKTEVKADSSVIKKSLTTETVEKYDTAFEKKTVIEFDTEKPIDSLTKTPPIKSITVIEKGQKSSEKAAKIEDKEKQGDYKIESDAKIKKDSAGTTVSKMEIATERKESQFLKWIAWIAGSIALVFFCIIVLKVIKVFKK